MQRTQTSLNTLTSARQKPEALETIFDEFKTFEDQEPSLESIIQEKQAPVFIPNISKIYGVSYGIFEEAIAQHDKKVEQQSRYSIMDFDFQKLPLPIHLINSPYLEHALSFLKIEKKRLKRLTYLSHSKLIQLLKKKHFSMILKIRKPKEQIFEILPFFISKAILIAIEDKIIEKISLIMSNDSSEHHIMRICSFVFQQINGMKLSDSAITKLIRQFLEVEKEREGNVRIVQMSNQEFKYLREIDGMNKDSPERQRLEDSDQDINYNQIQMQHNYHDLESIVSRQLQKAKSIRRLRTSEKSDRPVPNTGYQKQRYSLKEKALNQVTKNDEEVSPNQESKQQHDLRQNKVNNQDQNIENFKDEDENQNIQIVPLKNKFNVYKISDNMLNVYESKQFSSPLRKQLNFRQSKDRQKHDECPEFYMKYANYVIDKKQEERRNLKKIIRKMDVSSSDEEESQNPQSKDRNTQNQQEVANPYRDNRNNFINSKTEQKFKESEEQAMLDKHEEKVYRIDKLKEFINRCQTSQREQRSNDKGGNSILGVTANNEKSMLIRRQISKDLFCNKNSIVTSFDPNTIKALQHDKNQTEQQLPQTQRQSTKIVPSQQYQQRVFTSLYKIETNGRSHRDIISAQGTVYDIWC
eukprot:403377389